MREDLFSLILSVIPVLGAILTLYIIPLLKEKIGNEKLEKCKEWTMMAVKAAEMLWTETGMGADKKAYVVEFLTDMCNKHSLTITEQQMDVLIEACVKQLKLDEKVVK